eukprot:Phypoly_transcript_09803.p1 GENE.Phypoly_transcript_09803~~Phypoly_transcript_09803.p1  ORF type:complete len:383 (+),score=69.17 Phypoly_transcript_09803:85-1233(+)
MCDKIPDSIEGVTAEWLDAALHYSGILGSEVSVASIDLSKVEGGFKASVLRVNVSYTGSTACPFKFILKFGAPAKGDKSFDKELYFYQNADRIDLPGVFRAPKSYLTLKDGNKYLFLLEDLGHLKHISQKEGGADYETARRIVIALATFHAKYWNASPDALAKLRKEYCPVSEQDNYWESQQATMARSMDEFTSLVHDEELAKTSKFCAENLAQLVKEGRKPPCTLVHGDASLANYFLEGERGVVAVDWQGFDVGSGPGELAYFLSMSVQEEVRKKHETEFLHLYYDMLEKRGAFSKSDDFTFDSCYHKYLIGVATSSAVPILNAHGLIEYRKLLESSAGNAESSADSKSQIAAIHDNLKPMIDLWCTTAHNHPITSLHLEQ